MKNFILSFLTLLLCSLVSQAGVARFSARRVVKPAAKLSYHFAGAVARGEGVLGKAVVVTASRAVAASAELVGKIVY